MIRYINIILRMILIISAIISCFIFGGCSTEYTNTSTESISEIYNLGSKIDNDDIYIVKPNLNYVFYNKISYLRGFSVDILSSSNIETDKIKVNIDIKTPYTFDIQKVEDEKVDYFLYASYAGINWSEMEKLKEKNYDEYLEKLKIYQEEFNEIDREKIGKVFHYKIFIDLNFRTSGENESFNTINIGYKDKIYSIDIGNVTLDYSSSCAKKEKGLQMDVLSASEVEVVNNSDGFMTYPGTDMMSTTKKIQLNKIYLHKSSSKIKHCNIAIDNNDLSFEKEWDDTGISIDKNSIISTEIIVKNDKFIDKYMYQGNEYIVYEYECEGSDYLTYCEVVFNTKLTGYEMYAHYIDHKDIID